MPIVHHFTEEGKQSSSSSITLALWKEYGSRTSLLNPSLKDSRKLSRKDFSKSSSDFWPVPTNPEGIKGRRKGEPSGQCASPSIFPT